MSEHHPDYHNPFPSDDMPDEYAASYSHDDYDYYDEYSFDQDAYIAPEEDVSQSEIDTETHIPYNPENSETAPSQGVVWTKGRIFYALLVAVFVIVLVVYMLIPVIDHFLNPPPPPILPPPWMA